MQSHLILLENVDIRVIVSILPSVAASSRGVLNLTTNSGDAWYHSVKNNLSSNFFSKNLNDKIYKTVILPVVLETRKTVFSLVFHSRGRAQVRSV
jgi:hypothetical protein